mmetsp:Transcript_5938/g.24530  ORF Transcript_5938/g.24530 Transcript_5938/m.24530 type:complete len:397 (-) Transcript_5938:893-2083(-)
MRRFQVARLALVVVIRGFIRSGQELHHPPRLRPPIVPDVRQHRSGFQKFHKGSELVKAGVLAVRDAVLDHRPALRALGGPRVFLRRLERPPRGLERHDRVVPVLVVPQDGLHAAKAGAPHGHHVQVCRLIVGGDRLPVRVVDGGPERVQHLHLLLPDVRLLAQSFRRLEKDPLLPDGVRPKEEQHPRVERLSLDRVPHRRQNLALRREHVRRGAVRRVQHHRGPLRRQCHQRRVRFHPGVEPAVARREHRSGFDTVEHDHHRSRAVIGVDERAPDAVDDDGATDVHGTKPVALDPQPRRAQLGGGPAAPHEAARRRGGLGEPAVVVRVKVREEPVPAPPTAVGLTVPLEPVDDEPRAGDADPRRRRRRRLGGGDVPAGPRPAAASCPFYRRRGGCV